MSTPRYDIPVAHIDDPYAISRLEWALDELHGNFARVRIRTWSGKTVLPVKTAENTYRFVIDADNAAIQLGPGDTVRGGRGTAYEPGPDHSLTIEQHQESLWPGDAFVTSEPLGPALLSGSGAYLEVSTESTDYPAAKLSLLRNLGDLPGGCAAYDQAFRRETLPPAAVDASTSDRVGVNRVNEHTLDMRTDRTPGPSRHHHGAVAGAGTILNHTETAVILPRSCYGLPDVSGESSRVVIYRDPVERGTTDSFTIPVRPGSIVVTPSTPDRLFGHCFENAFAMLIAIPGFVAPYEVMD